MLSRNDYAKLLAAVHCVHRRNIPESFSSYIIWMQVVLSRASVTRLNAGVRFVRQWDVSGARSRKFVRMQDVWKRSIDYKLATDLF